MISSPERATPLAPGSGLPASVPAWPSAAALTDGSAPLVPARLVLRGVEFAPALFCAPMAGLTHSAFRRLVADFGGYGALFTEMLSGRWLLRENLATSPSVKRRPQEGRVIYQLMIGDPADVPAIVGRLERLQPLALDLNCACPAPQIRAQGAGSELFEDRERLAAILDPLRRLFPGPLTVKIRLGSSRPGWEERLADRLRLFEDCGIDAVILHPRFSEEKLKRRARHEWLARWAASTRLPLLASGDLHTAEPLRRWPERFAGVAGIMVGRMAVVQPWRFRVWNDDAFGNASPFTPDYLGVWQRFVRYVREDFPAERVVYRVKDFTMYYSRNFTFGHTLFAAAQSARDMDAFEAEATRFLAAEPRVAATPYVEGLA